MLVLIDWGREINLWDIYSARCPFIIAENCHNQPAASAIYFAELMCSSN
jgi:hypothetical protein